MKIRNILSHAFKVVAKHRDIFLVFSFVYAVMLFTALFLGALGGLTLVLVIFVFLPLQFSFYLIAKKMQEEKPIEPNDIYLGFKGILTSLALGSKMMFRGFLNGVVAFVIGLLVGGIGLSYFIMSNYPSLLEVIMANPSNLDLIVVELDRYPLVVNLVIIIYLLALVFAGFIYLKEASKNSIAPLVLFEAPFDLNSSIRISRKVNKLKQNKLTLIYLIFLVALIVVTSLSFGLGAYLFNASGLDELVLVALIFMMFSLLFAPLNILFVVVKSSYYQLFAKKEVLKILEEIKTGLESTQNDSNLKK